MLAQQFAESLPDILKKHNSILDNAIISNNGFVFKTVGDSFCCAFQNAADALKAAVSAQKSLSEEKWGDAVVKVRIGIHSGNAEWNGSDYMGYMTLARSSRIMSAANGGQIILSDKSYELIKESIPGNISFRDLGVRRLKDVIQPVRLFQINAPGLREDFPPLKTLDARPNNLPVQMTSFIGRENEMKELKEIISKERLVTLIGTGGTGKTRLSLQAGADMIDEFANGVWLIELAQLTKPLQIPAAIVKVLGLKEIPEKKPEDTVTEFLKNKEILLILDNCEHLINECAELAGKFLQSSPRLKILATSREALSISGEKTYRVKTLEHPDPNDKISTIKLAQYEAVRLFIERSLTVNPGFRVNDDNAHALALICFQLDGIPLAIELAAARTVILSPDQICKRLTDRFKLLTGGKRTDMPKQKTLRAMIDWSYDLLNDKEKIFLQKLSVFSGGWSLEAAEEICEDEYIRRTEVLDLTESLINKSLIFVTATDRGYRYNILETIKMFAVEKLALPSAVRKKHFEYYCRLTDYEKMILDGLEQLEWIRTVETDYDNVRAAIQYSFEYDPQSAFRIVSLAGIFWNLKSYFREGLQNCLKALSITPVSDRKTYARILAITSHMKSSLGEYEEAKRLITESLNIFREINDLPGIANSLNFLGKLAYFNLEIDDSIKLHEEALSISRTLNSKGQIAESLNNLASAIGSKKIKEMFDLAFEYREEALKLYRETGDTHNVAFTLSLIGMYNFFTGNYKKAKSYAEESLEKSRLIGDHYQISQMLGVLGCIYMGKEDFDAAELTLNEALHITNEFGYTLNLIPLNFYSGEVSRLRGDFHNSIHKYKESIRAGVNSEIKFFLSRNFLGIALSLFGLQDYERSALTCSFTDFLIEIKKIHIEEVRIGVLRKTESELKTFLGIEKFQQIVKESEKYDMEEAIDLILNY